MKRVFAFATIGAVILVFLWGLFTFNSLNHFDDIVSNFDGRCDAVSGIAGPEDVQVDFITRKAFISSLDRRAALNGSKESLRGAIYLFDINNPLSGASWLDRTNGLPEKFAPSGIHFYQEGPVRRLFVVNDATKQIELFDVSLDGNLTHLESFTERRLTSPKDVVATGPRSFYVTNDTFKASGSLKGNIDFLFRRRSGVVFYFNGTSWHKAAENIRYANGIGINKKGDRLYITETAAENLIEYSRDRETGYLTLERRIGTGAAVDNINIDEDGVFWIGAHPRPIALVRHSRDKNNLAPSKVFSFNSETDELNTIYTDDGTLLSGSSSAARINRKLIIGSLYEEKFLLCNMHVKQPAIEGALSL